LCNGLTFIKNLKRFAIVTAPITNITRDINISQKMHFHFNQHNLDVIKTADWIVDLGPEGGDKGGDIIAVGTPEEIAQVKKSYTGQYLHYL
jgi:hypothetical protein